MSVFAAYLFFNLEIRSRIGDYYIFGQAHEEAAYAYTRVYESNAGLYSQEVFDESGYLIAVQDCTEIDDYFCDDYELDEDLHELFISPYDINEAITDWGFNDVHVTGLPASVYEFLVLENDPDTPLWLGEEYCDGWQPVAGEIELFCFVPDFELSNSVVVSIDGDELVEIPSARVLVGD